MLVVALIALRAVGPSDLYDKDQPAVVGQVIDVAVNGNWLLPSEPGYGLPTKPPMYPWLAGLGVMVTGLNNEFILKLPSVIAFVVTCVVIIELGREHLGIAGGCVAAALFAANPQVFKVMYLARTDMLITMLLSIALWAVLKQRAAWQRAEQDSPPTNWWIALFWFCLCATLLTKGPVAVIPLIWLVLVIAVCRAWKRCHLLAQVLGLVLAVAVSGAWFWAALYGYPEWWDTLHGEVGKRVVGSRDTPYKPWSAPLYVLSRFIPWSPLMVGGAVLSIVEPRAQRDPAHPQQWEGIAWALGWVVMVLLVFMTQATQRADRLMPIYPAAAVLAAGVIIDAGRCSDWRRVLVRWVLVGVAFAGIASAVGLMWLLRSLGTFPLAFDLTQSIRDDMVRSYTIAITLAALAATASGAAVLVWVRRHQYIVAAIGSCVVVGALVGIERMTMSAPARSRTGDLLIALVKYARASGEPVAFHEIGYSPLQALYGTNLSVDGTALDRVIDGGWVITGQPEPVLKEFGPRAKVLIET